MTPEQGVNQALPGLNAVPPHRDVAVTSTATRLDGSTNESALVVEHLSKRFGERTAFSDVSFQVAYGEVFGFLGPNGAGKTTTVRTLGTLIAATSGAATVAGIPLNEENGADIRKRISIMPESPGLYWRLTVTENLEYFAGLYGLRRASPRITGALAAVNLVDRADDLCGGLSKGLRQRVALARTLLSDPAVLFLDEPTSGLDPVARPRGAPPDRRAPAQGGDDLPHHPPARRSREALRPGRHLEHDTTDRRPAPGPASAAVHQRAGGQDPGGAARPRPALRPHPYGGELALRWSGVLCSSRCPIPGSPHPR